MAQIHIVNKARIVNGFLSNAIGRGGKILPDGRLILLFSDRLLDEGDTKYDGMCVHRDILKYSPVEPLFDEFADMSWDCGVVMAQRSCAMRENYPAFFTYLLGHEFGHAFICMSNLKLFIHCCLIEHFIGTAAGSRKILCQELPHELACDRFGIYLAELLHLRRKLDSEIGGILAAKTRGDSQRLQQMLLLTGSPMPVDMRRQIVDFSRPYKKALIKLWENHRREYGVGSMASMICDYQALFT